MLSHIVRSARLNSTISACPQLLLKHKYRVKTQSKFLLSTTCHQNTDHLVIKDAIKTPINLNYLWLRDHCRCSECYSLTTNQRLFDCTTLELNIVPHKATIQQNKLIVNWSDGHNSSYDLDWLYEVTYEGKQATQPRPQYCLWSNANVENCISTAGTVKYDDYMANDNALKKLLTSLMNVGFGLVTEAPSTEQATGQAAERLCFIQETLFGRLWTFTADLARSDTAYTSIPLAAHTDTTYLMSTAGIQVFHCLYHDGSGGETLLVDGFNAAHALNQSDPDAFKTLNTVSVPGEYIEYVKGKLSQSTVGKAPVIATDSATGHLEKIRFNLYDRAPFSSIPHTSMKQFYSSLSSFSRIIRSKENEYWLKLNPGTILFIDNWRVLHGRSSFTGKRIITGCYLPHDDYMSRMRSVCQNQSNP